MASASRSLMSLTAIVLVTLLPFIILTPQRLGKSLAEKPSMVSMKCAGTAGCGRRQTRTGMNKMRQRQLLLELPLCQGTIIVNSSSKRYNMNNNLLLGE